MEEFVDGGGRAINRLQFAKGEGREIEHGGPAGKTLSDCLDQLELAGADEDETAHAPICIDGALEIREQGGDALDFIDDATVRNLEKEEMSICIARYAGGLSRG